MNIRKYSYVDVFYNKNETDKALLERRRLIDLGYELQVEDDAGGDYDFCDQYLKLNKPYSIFK